MLKFRNIDVTPDDPVELWGVEGILTAIERGDIRHWRRIISAIRKDPGGEVEAQLREALSITDSSRRHVLKAWCDDVHQSPRDAAVRNVQHLIRQLHLPQAVIARRLNTSRARVSQWTSGAALPDAQNIEKLRRMNERRELLLWGGSVGCR